MNLTKAQVELLRYFEELATRKSLRAQGLPRPPITYSGSLSPLTIRALLALGLIHDTRDLRYRYNLTPAGYNWLAANPKG
jgi:hypothetical protein